MSVDIRCMWLSSSTYDLHKRLINQYLLNKPGATRKLVRDTTRDKRDIDVIRENHKFLWNEEEVPDSWEAQLAKKYYDKLFKEYSICDLRRYKDNMVAMRWRTEKEVVAGKGQFSCADKYCENSEGLKTWEVNFGYLEMGEKKNALVKIRLCESCSQKLNYNKQHKEVAKKGKKNKKEKSLRKRASESLNEEIIDVKKIKTEDEKQNSEKDEEKERTIWKEVGEMPEERSREEEFNDYLEDLLL